MSSTPTKQKTSEQKIKEQIDDAQTAGQRQAFNFVNEILAGKNPGNFGYIQSECEQMRAKLKKLIAKS
jgi:hypothetical protein